MVNIPWPVPLDLASYTVSEALVARLVRSLQYDHQSGVLKVN